jgi:hypothetical protein
LSRAQPGPGVSQGYRQAVAAPRASRQPGRHCGSWAAAAASNCGGGNLGRARRVRATERRLPETPWAEPRRGPAAAAAAGHCHASGSPPSVDAEARLLPVH